MWSVAFVRAIAWTDRGRPSGWRRLVAPPLVFLVIGLLSIVFSELLGNGQDVPQLLFLHPLAPLTLTLLVLVRPLATVASAASGAPGGLFTPTLASGALAGADLGDSGFGFIREAKSACPRFSAQAQCSRRPRRDRSRRSC